MDNLFILFYSIEQLVNLAFKCAKIEQIVKFLDIKEILCFPGKSE